MMCICIFLLLLSFTYSDFASFFSGIVLDWLFTLSTDLKSRTDFVISNSDLLVHDESLTLLDTDGKIVIWNTRSTLVGPIVITFDCSPSVSGWSLKMSGTTHYFFLILTLGSTSVLQCSPMFNHLFAFQYLNNLIKISHFCITLGNCMMSKWPFLKRVVGWTFIKT